jgi:hypothetical protein
VSLACSATASAPRRLAIVGASAGAALVDPKLLCQLTLVPRPGAQTLSFALTPDAPDFELSLSPADRLPDNDRATAARATEKLRIAVVTDESQARAATGGATVIEQALLAVRPTANVRPLGILPQRAEALEGYAALVVNDPRGLGPEPRAALSDWLESGGVALGLLGPAAASLQLSSTLEPFAERSARWEPLAAEQSLDAASVAWLDPGGTGLSDLTRSGRMLLDGAALPGAQSVGAWLDGVPFLLSRRVGAGRVLSAGLPASVAHSELSLRPLFLALHDHVLGAAESRRGPDLSPAGARWTFQPGRRVEIEGPGGPVGLERDACDEGDANPSCPPGQLSAVVDLAGRYAVRVDGVEQTRVVRIDESESVDAPGDVRAGPRPSGGKGPGGSIDASPELALVLLGLFALELAVRVGSQARRRRRPGVGATP